MSVSAAGEDRRVLLRALLLLLVLTGCLAVVYFTPLRDLLKRAPEISDYLKTLGWRAPVLFTAAVAVLTAVGVPRLLLCPIAGMAFLFYWGLLWSQIGTLMGFYATFLFVRWGGKAWIMRRWPRLDRLAHAVRGRGFTSVFLVRQLPLGGIYINILLGLTHVRHRDFLLGTLLGILPEAIPAVLLGASAKQVAIERIFIYFLIAVALFMLVALGVRHYLKRSQAPTAVLVREALNHKKEIMHDERKRIG